MEIKELADTAGSFFVSCAVVVQLIDGVLFIGWFKRESKTVIAFLLCAGAR